MDDHIIRCLVHDPLARVVAVVSTEVTREAARRHGAVAGAAVALGRAATTGLLLATLTKGGERVTLQITGDGSFEQIMVDATDAGEARAYLKHADALVPCASGQRAVLVPGVGRAGTVTVLRDLGLKERFSGSAPLIAGEIDVDVEHYLRTSEQIESALGCEVDSDGSHVLASAGVLVQCMPDGDALDLVREVRHRMRNGHLFAALRDGGYAEDVARAILGEAGARLEVLDIRPVRFHCPCSPERVLGALASLPDDELLAMVHDDGGAEVTCDFCREVYQLSADALQALLETREPHAKT